MKSVDLTERNQRSATSRTLRAWQVFGIFCFLLSVGLIVALLIIVSNVEDPRHMTVVDPQHHNPTNQNGGEKKNVSRHCPNKCTMGMTVTPRDLENPTVFQDLSEAEINVVRDYLQSDQSLRLEKLTDAKVNSSYLYLIELNAPLKQEVLEFLDRNGPKPERTAKAIVIRGDLDPPIVEEFIVGPLPIPLWHKTPNNTGYKKYPIPFDYRPQSGPEFVHLGSIINAAAADMYQLLMESYGASYHNCTAHSKCLRFEILSQLNLEGLGRKVWYIAVRNIEGLHLHPVGTEILVSNSGSNTSTFAVEKVMYNGQMFDSVDELMMQYRRNNVTKLNLTFPEDDDTLFSTFRRRGQDPMEVLRRGPRMYEPDGHRYMVVGQHVQYMAWSFDFRIRQVNSIQMLDIRFNGDRIAYEISVQEFAAFYSGFGPNQISTRYLDTAYAMRSFELTKGVDCPHSATYLDTFGFIDSDQPLHHKNSICIFEYDSALPLMRHYSNDYAGSFDFYGGINGYSLVVRTIATIYNYDYIIDFLFYNNGVIQVRETATGYVMANFGLLDELNGYAFPIFDHVVGNIHHHIFNYKVDLDIKGEKNRFATLDITTETIPHPWYPEFNVTQARFDRNLRATEMEAAIKFKFEEPRYYIVYSQNSTNRLGSNRGYRVENAGMSKFVLPDEGDPRVVRWAKYQIAVTKYKANESSSSCPYTLANKYDPLVDFDSFIADDESLVDEDLVLWLTMGIHHIPITEDIPSVFTTGGERSFYLRPFNYFDECPTVSSRDTVYIVPGEDGQTANVNMYGKGYQADCQPREEPFSYDGRYGK